MKKVYLSGPISGLERKEYMRRFAVAEEKARALGYEPVNPTKFLLCNPILYRLAGYRLTLLYDLWQLSRCDCIAYLPGNTWSRGSRTERDYAWACHIPEAEHQIDIWRAVEQSIVNN